MKFKETPFLLGSLIVTVILATFFILISRPTAVVNASNQAPNTRPPLVLTPKSQLISEKAAWTFAPEVPAPITRKDQRREIVNWTVKEAQAEIAPGVIYDSYWGFEGHVPGPILRVREGDLVEIHVTNGSESQNPHNIDFHFASGPGGGASALNVPPGKSAVLEARAMVPGFYMFHCATPDIPMHIANGMYGFVIVEPAEGMPAVDKELYVVQSEIYTKDGKQGHQQFSMERGEKMDPQYVVFNGAVGSLMKEKAPHVLENQRVRIFVGNAGPNLISSFHVIGQIFDKVYREGDLISPPARGVQTTLIPAGGAAVVEFQTTAPGNYLMVDHAIFRLHHGGAGTIVVDGPQNAEIFEPMTQENMGEMSADAHLGGGMMMQHEMHAPPAAPVAAPVLAKAAGFSTVRILEGSGLPNHKPNRDFSPKVLTVKLGTAVYFQNTDVLMAHSVRGDNNEFVSTLMQPNDSWSMVPQQRGVIHYTCTPHPWMKGTIVVK
jgi:Putative multicopper oxidases